MNENVGHDEKRKWNEQWEQRVCIIFVAILLTIGSSCLSRDAFAFPDDQFSAAGTGYHYVIATYLNNKNGSEKKKVLMKTTSERVVERCRRRRNGRKMLEYILHIFSTVNNEPWTVAAWSECANESGKMRRQRRPERNVIAAFVQVQVINLVSATRWISVTSRRVCSPNSMLIYSKRKKRQNKNDAEIYFRAVRVWHTLRVQWTGEE